MAYRLPRGTFDIQRGQVEKWQWLESIFRKQCELHHFSEIRTPIFEHTDLFVRGVGETTDIVGKEMYTFPDRGNRSMTLRPEGTAGIVRSFVEHKGYSQPGTTKYYYLGPMFRYENPQAGRYRQFHQLGTEVFGSSDPALDAELIALGMQFFASLGLTGVHVEINSVGDAECRPRYREQLVQYFRPMQDQLSAEDKKRLESNPMRILDSKDPNIQELINQAPTMLDASNTTCLTHFEQLKQYLDDLQIPYVVNPRLVRGLDYYTMTAFEFMADVDGVHAGTIGGGGRYNGLVQELGGPDVPGIGFGIGIERVLLACEQQQLALPERNSLDCFVVTLDDSIKRQAIKIMQQLRLAGFTTDMDYTGRKVKAQMKAANRSEARYVAFIGEDEIASNQVSVKDMTTGEQLTIPVGKVVQHLQNKE